MNGIMDLFPKEKLLGVEGAPKEMMAAGSLAAGVGLFVMSFLVILAVGFFAGALVLMEKLARNVLREDEEETEVEPATVMVAQRMIPERVAVPEMEHSPEMELA